MKNSFGIDIEQVLREANKQKINFREITLFYEGLSDSEIKVLRDRNLFKDNSKIVVFGQIDDTGKVYFPDKIADVHYLGA